MQTSSKHRATERNSKPSATDELTPLVEHILLAQEKKNPGLKSKQVLLLQKLGSNMSDEPLPGNPASFYCADLGGSSQFGSGATGGGWVDRDDPDDLVVAMCVFPDGSTIDEWGIAYYSGDVVRGADLAPLFRADTAAFPPIFASGAA